jgi:AAA family ATP:ADP antiporter
VLAAALIEPVGLKPLLLLSAAILILSLLVNNYIESRSAKKVAIPESKDVTTQDEPKISKADALKVVLRNKYLLMIALIVLFSNVVNTTGEYILGRSVETAAYEAADTASVIDTEEVGFIEEYIGAFYSRFFSVVGLLGLLFQLFLVSRIIKFFGMRVGLVILPIIAFAGYTVIALVPLLAVIRWSKVGENATDYSLQNTVRHILFLPTTREEKYKAKVAIDSIFQRLGDVLSALLVFLGVTYFSFAISQFALVNLCIVIIWLVLAIRVGMEYRRLMARKSG